ncbi:MAG: hypothetical protein Q8S54_09960 [Bacteroidota bacterium]|nr:hypothetical protein [Bacteroidota bacterium]
MNKSLRLDILQDERTRLKAEFDQLETIEQKYNFWAEKLERNYFLWALYEQDNIQDFLICPQNGSETETLNKLIYSEYSLMTSSNKILNDLKKSFIDQIETSTDKETLVEYELTKIVDYISKRKQVPISENVSQNEKNSFFIRGYEDYLLKKKEIDWQEKVYQAHLLLEKIQGIEWAKYREFVKNYLKPEKKQIEIKLNGEQKFLILHHLGFGNELNTDEDRSMLYEFFIDELKLKSIQRLFPNITDHETEKNLDILIDFFRLIKLNSKARELADKLAKLKQRPQRK